MCYFFLNFAGILYSLTLIRANIQFFTIGIWVPCNRHFFQIVHAFSVISYRELYQLLKAVHTFQWVNTSNMRSSSLLSSGQKLSSVNGVLFTGGSEKQGVYFETIKKSVSRRLWFWILLPISNQSKTTSQLRPLVWAPWPAWAEPHIRCN